ncbi:hypothetical protein ACWED2_44590 [Amycolatopsis sp. NPDC005003]
MPTTRTCRAVVAGNVKTCPVASGRSNPVRPGDPAMADGAVVTASAARAGRYCVPGR